MNNKWKVCVTAAICCTASLSTGCQSLPWGGNRIDETAVTADPYVEQAAANIQYDTEIDMDNDYQAPAAKSFSPARNSSPPSLSSGGGSCCH